MFIQPPAMQQPPAIVRPASPTTNTTTIAVIPAKPVTSKATGELRNGKLVINYDDAQLRQIFPKWQQQPGNQRKTLADFKSHLTQEAERQIATGDQTPTKARPITITIEGKKWKIVIVIGRSD